VFLEKSWEDFRQSWWWGEVDLKQIFSLPHYRSTLQLKDCKIKYRKNENDDFQLIVFSHVIQSCSVAVPLYCSGNSAPQNIVRIMCLFWLKLYKNCLTRSPGWGALSSYLAPFLDLETSLWQGGVR